MSSQKQGSLLAIAAFSIWGGFPFYFKIVGHINPLDVLANRIIWAALCLFLLLLLLKKYWLGVLKAFADKKQLLYLVLTTVLIATNWGVYIWAVDTNQLFEASLGYYINPLFNVFLGFVLLKESLSRTQWWAVILAAVGVSIQIIAYGRIPLIALTLAFSFGLYGFFHKKMSVDSIPGLFIETILLLPVVLLFLGWLANSNQKTIMGPLSWSMQDWLWLSLAGPVTIIPLLLFTAAAKRIAYSTLAFIQYITPSILFILALFYYQEPFSVYTLVTFLFIWLALALFSADLFMRQRKRMLTKPL